MEILLSEPMVFLPKIRTTLHKLEIFFSLWILVLYVHEYADNPKSNNSGHERPYIHKRWRLIYDIICVESSILIQIKSCRLLFT